MERRSRSAEDPPPNSRGSLMARRLTDDQIKQFWSDQADEHGQSTAASWSDRPVIELEAAELVNQVRDGERILDVGCANGYTTLRLAAERAIAIKGIDYIPQMIEEARSRLANVTAPLRGKVDFAVGDARRLDEPDDSYDTAISVRVIINLGDWAGQEAGLRECARVVKPGGRLLLSEATTQGWRKLNDFRREWGLDDIPMPAFNAYLDRDQVIETLSPTMRLVGVSHFASTYYVGTRVIKPLLARALGGSIDVADPGMHWNAWFSQLPAWGDYGTQELMIFEKR
jgi:ubiquinone/menaquinone biosynthesis C-methylase UbiE